MRCPPVVEISHTSSCKPSMHTEVLVPDAVVKVSFEVKGAGRLVGVGNGNPHNVDSFQRPRRWTWHGNALAILRPTKTPGSLSLSATAEGLKSATLTLEVMRGKSRWRSATRSGAGRSSILAPGRILLMAMCLVPIVNPESRMITRSLQSGRAGRFAPGPRHRTARPACPTMRRSLSSQGCLRRPLELWPTQGRIL